MGIQSMCFEGEMLKRGRPIRLLACVFAVVTVLSSVAHADLIADGGFEQPIVGPGGFNSGFQAFGVGQTIGSAWLVVGSGAGNVAVVPGTETSSSPLVTLAPHGGSQSLDLTGDTDNGAATGVEQVITTTPGTEYTLSFWVGDLNNAQYPFSGAASVSVFLNGSAFQTATNDGASGLTPNWELFSYNFAATGTSTTLDFINNTKNVSNVVGLNGLDDASVNPATAGSVPEPSAILLMATLVALTGLVVRRRPAA
jgi:hypothetical protein